MKRMAGCGHGAHLHDDLRMVTHVSMECACPETTQENLTFRIFFRSCKYVCVSGRSRVS